MFVYIHTKCSGFTDWIVWRALQTHQMDKKESSFMGLVGFECPLRDEKKLLLEQENLFRFSVKFNIYLKSCIHLKSENVNIENEGASGKNF